MSFVGSASSFENRKLYTLKHANDNSGLSTSLFNTDKQRGILYSNESYSNDSYGLKYLLDSPSGESLPTSVSDALENSLPSSYPSSYQLVAGQNSFSSSSLLPAKCADPFQFTNESELGCQGPDSMDYDEYKVRLKLQDLERKLFDDNDVVEDTFGHGSMETDDRWPYSTQNLMLHDSPNESSSLDSHLSRISSNKEICVSVMQNPKQLLFECATAIQLGNIREASTVINELRQRVSIQGDPTERIAAYMVEALAARIATSGKGLYKALKCKEAPSHERLSAMQVLFEVCPCFRFGFMAANNAILEAFKDEKRVHIIDFDINQGSQYYTLLQTLAELPHKPKHLRLTGVDDPESVQRAVGSIKVIGQRLEKLAIDLKIPFEFCVVAANTADVTPEMLNCDPGDTLIVNFAFQLHHMPDESVSTVNQRDQLLRMVKSLNPKLVTVVEQEVNTNTAPFLPRFSEAYNYYSAVFDSLNATLPRDSQERMNVERQCLARDIINIVACEGEERIERYEVSGKWRSRMVMAGFNLSPISQNVKDEIRKLITLYSNRFRVEEESNAIHFGWEDKILIVASAWR